MTKTLLRYLLLLFVSLFFRNANAQVTPADSTLKDTNIVTQMADTSMLPKGKGGASELPENAVVKQKSHSCDTITYKVRKFLNEFAEETGIRRLEKPIYRFLEKRLPGDTITVFKHSPKKASWLSAVVPGLGQIYNRKYWKLPIIYVGFGVIGYLAVNYNTKAQHYKSSYLFRKGIDLGQKDYYPEIFSEDVLYSNFTYYRRNFELTCIFGSLFYVLNIIDASVDAHLYKFDITDDLSMKIEPALIYYEYTSYNTPSTGLKISLHF